jgi:colicin import membrane protein
MSRLAANGPPPEPGATGPFLLALAVHLAFLAFLMFAASWRTEPPEGMAAELWSSLPPTPQPPPAPEARPEPAGPPPPEPRAEPKPEPSPDIALKEKQEQERKKRVEEQQKKQEAEKRRLEQQKAAEAERLRREQERQQEELAQLAREQEEIHRRIEAQAQAAAARARVLDEHKGRIVAKIRRFIVMPPDVPGNPEAQFEVVLLPSGEVLSAKLRKSSGHAAYDQAVERAILKAQPLPLPPDPALFASFRNLELRFRPVE